MELHHGMEAKEGSAGESRGRLQFFYQIDEVFFRIDEHFFEIHEFFKFVNIFKFMISFANS